MRPAASGPDTLMDLATKCAANEVRPAAPTWLVIARQETAQSSVAIPLGLILFMTSLPFCSQGCRARSLVLRAGRARPGERARPHPLDQISARSLSRSVRENQIHRELQELEGARN